MHFSIFFIATIKFLIAIVIRVKIDLLSLFQINAFQWRKKNIKQESWMKRVKNQFTQFNWAMSFFSVDSIEENLCYWMSNKENWCEMFRSLRRNNFLFDWKLNLFADMLLLRFEKEESFPEYWAQKFPKKFASYFLSFKRTHKVKTSLQRY